MVEKKSCTQGFTLIELLVVVLIIGVLASIAVPQYQRAVDKARATEAVVQGRALQNALILHYQSTGEFVPADLEVLPWEMPEKLQWVYVSGTGFYTRTPQKSGAYFEIARYHANSYNLDCIAFKANDEANKLCEQFGKLEAARSAGRERNYYLIHRAYLY